MDAGEAAREALEQLGAAADETGARIELGELPILSADRSQVVLLFQHLVSNALKFHGDAPPRIAVTATRSVSDWRLDVRDGGTGIDPERVDELFKMFHRLDGEHYEGSGIGLAVCKRIVERHGGRIWYEPAPDGGSVFSFTIPDAAP